jgi:hypothetical protein
LCFEYERATNARNNGLCHTVGSIGDPLVIKMAVQLSNETVQDATSEIWVAEFGVLSGQGFDFENKKYAGKIYRLIPESAKSLAEALGFTARFEAGAVRVAYLDACKNDVTVVLEMARNTKPGDVALRYSGDRWTVAESATRGNDALRPWRRTSYRAKSLSDQALLALCDAARIEFGDREKFYIRINFKDGTSGLIAEEEHLGKFPGSAYSSFCLPLGRANVVQSQHEDVEKMAPLETTRATFESSTGRNGSPGAKYATYSRSEVDQLLKQQSDQLITVVGNKVGSQKKDLQEALKTQEKSIAKIAEDLRVYSENVKKQLDNEQTQKHADIDDSVDQARRDLMTQIEQFKTHLNKSVLPSLKNLDDRVRTIVEATIQPPAKPQQTSNGPPVLVLAAIALLISVINSVLLLARH